MKRFLVCLVLIFTLLFNVFADNKKAHKELRKEFEKYELLPELKARGFDLKKLDKIDDMDEMIEYLESYFVDENGMPLDNHVDIFFNRNLIDTLRQMHIDFLDEYGSKDELLNKGYKEDEIFYYPYFNGEWNEDGYRVGKKYMGDRIYMEDIGIQQGGNYFVNSENALLVGFERFYNDQNEIIYKEISMSNKEYLILDLSYNGGGRDVSYLSLIDAINKMKPKEIFIMISGVTASMGEWATSWIEKATNIKTTIIGHPTLGGWKCGKKSKIIDFDDFSIDCRIDDKDSNWKWGWDMYNIPYPTEGIGVTPDIYTENSFESLEVIKHLINDNKLSLPY